MYPDPARRLFLLKPELKTTLQNRVPDVLKFVWMAGNGPRYTQDHREVVYPTVLR
jgi:hypothetical protein